MVDLHLTRRIVRYYCISSMVLFLCLRYFPMKLKKSFFYHFLCEKTTDNLVLHIFDIIILAVHTNNQQSCSNHQHLLEFLPAWLFSAIRAKPSFLKEEFIQLVGGRSKRHNKANLV